MSFIQAYKVGQRGEEFVRDLLNEYKMEAELNDNHDERHLYDISAKLGRKKFTLEVKFDMMAQKTGNIAIEFWNSKKNHPSGLSITQANIWAHCLLDGNNLTVWFASVPKLKDFIEHNPPSRIIACGGDNNASLYLYKQETILDKIMFRAETLSERKMKKLIRTLLKND